MLEQTPGNTVPRQSCQLPPSEQPRMCLQGEAYEEDDSCAAVDQTQACIESEKTSHSAMHEEAPIDSALEWQQAFDPTYGSFYYYRESTQVSDSCPNLTLPAAWVRRITAPHRVKF